MPEFILQRDGEVKGLEFADLDSFTQGFIEAGFWQSEAAQTYSEEWEDSEEFRDGLDGSIPCDVGFADLEADSLQSIADLCAAFQRDNAELLDQAYERDYDATQAGRDYWLTHTGSGVGFWDRDVLTKDVHAAHGSPRVGEPGWDAYAKAKEDSLGERLSKAAGRGEFYLEFNPDGEGGGTVYFTGY